MPEPAFFGAGIHPDLPPSLIHFTGRPRGNGDQPPQFAQGTPEERLIRILQGGCLRASPTFGTVGPVLCLSEPSETALGVLLSTGVTFRGPYAPWAVLIERKTIVDGGFRPVWHMSALSANLV
jgi:hypothetical protein